MPQTLLPLRFPAERPVPLAVSVFGRGPAAPGFPGAVLALLFCAGPFLFGGVDRWGQSLLTGGVFAAAMAWIVMARGAVTWPSVGALAAGGLALLAFFQTRSAGVPWDVGPALRTASRQGALDAARLWAAWAVVLWMGGALFGAPRRRRAAVGAVVSAIVVFAALGVILHGQSATDVFGRPMARAGMFFATYVNRNQAAALLAAGLCLGAGLWLARIKAFRDWDSFGERANLWSMQLLILSGLGLLGFAFALTGSRGALHAWSLSSFLVLSVGFLWSRRFGRFFVMLAAAGVYAAAAYSFPQSLGLSPLGWDGPVRERLAIWDGALSLWRDQRIFGAGLGAFKDAFAGYQSTLLGGRVEHAHSEWLEALAGGGVVGAALFFLATAGVWIAALWRWRREADPGARCLDGGLLAAAGGFLFHGLVDFPLQMPANAGLFFFCLACLSRRPLLDAFLPPRVLSFLLLAPLGALLFFSVKPAAAWAYVHRAGPVPLNEKAHLLETALRWEPFDAGVRRRLGAVYLALSAQEPSAQRLFARQALEQAEACLKDAPADAGCLDVAAGALETLGRADDAAGRRAEALRLRPWRGARP